MILLSSLTLAAASAVFLSQDEGARRAGYTCVLWPQSAGTSVEARGAKSFTLSWAFTDQSFEAHPTSDVELLEGPAPAGAAARVTDYVFDEGGINLLVEGKNGRYLLTAVPRKGKLREFEAGFGPLDGKGTENVGACTEILADKKMIADLKRRNGI